MWSSPSSEYWQARNTPYLNNNKWVSGVEKDANLELAEGQTLESLRKISSRSVKNNFLAAGIIQALVNNVIGGKMVVKIIYPVKSIEKQINFRLKSVLKAVDINDEMTIEQWCETMTTGGAERGDMLVNMTKYKKKRTGTTVVPELIEASRILTPNYLKSNKYVVNGVETDKDGRVKYYHVLKNDNDLVAKYGYNTGINDEDQFDKIPAFRKIRGKEVRAAALFKIPTNQRPNQTRMPPLITPIMGLLRFFQQYLEAILVSARVAACFVGVMKVENAVGSDMNLKGLDGQPDFAYTELQPGTLMTTEIGKGDITFASPNRPSDNVDSFLKRLCMFISMAMRDPYISLFLDLSEANYSNYKGGMNEKERMINRWRDSLTWFLEFYLSNVLKDFRTNTGLRFSMDKIEYDITFPKFQAGDPEKKARSQKTEIGNQTTTQKYICEEDQINYEKLIDDLIEQAQNEVKIEAEKLLAQKIYEEKYGIIFPDKAEPQDRVTEGAEEQPSGKIDVDEEDKKEKRKEGGNW